MACCRVKPSAGWLTDGCWPELIPWFAQSSASCYLVSHLQKRSVTLVITQPIGNLASGEIQFYFSVSNSVKKSSQSDLFSAYGMRQ